MKDFDLDGYVGRSRALDLRGIAWETIALHPLPPEAVRTLRYMQDIESHTIIYLRTLLSTRALDDPEIATFLACWFYEETFHGRALARFLEAAGHGIVQRTRSRMSVGQRLEACLTARLAKIWPDFVAVHMAWGAINELSTLTGYQRLAALAAHPILSELLARIIKDESRHFYFYYRQAERRLQKPSTARLTRFLVGNFWAPVGSGVQPATETRFLARYLFAGTEGRRAARKLDDHIRQLPGFEGVALLESWIDRHADPQPATLRISPLSAPA